MKNKNIRNLLVINLIISIIFIIILLLMMQNQYFSYKKAVNNTINNILYKIEQKYPKVNEEELIEILKKNNEKGKDILLKYGYEDSSAIKELEDNINKYMKINIILIIAICLSLSLIYIIIFEKQNRRIKEINKYLKEINNKNYSLKIEQNGEDELSKLQNELYKTTVLLKEVAEKSVKEKDELSNSLADISHQLKTPLTSITIMLDNITQNEEMDEKTKLEFIREINKQIDWINSLVISLLKLAKFDAGVIKMNNQNVDINKLLNNVITNLSILLEIKNIEVIINIQKNVMLICDYKWQLEAITNIVKNAAEHSKDNYKIYIDVENTSMFLKITIKDEGNGINKEDLKHIFQRFYKSNNSLENSIGIGLPLAKAIIEKNNGDIKVESKENEGTKFEIIYMK